MIGSMVMCTIRRVVPLSVLLAALSLFAFVPQAHCETQAPQAGEQIKWQVVSGGGTTNGTSASYRLSTTVGQTAAGWGSSPSYNLNQGFQQNHSTCNCGDADGSGAFSIADAVYIINYIFAGGAAPNPLCEGDANGSGGISIADAVHLINYIFAGGPAPTC